MLLENCSNTGDLRPGPDALAFQAANADFFSGLFENRVTKIAAVTFSMIGSYSCIVLLYSIIWYEKFGSDCKRTLINRLFVYFWFYPLTWEATLQQLDMVRYIFGPLPRIFCRFTYFCKLHFTIHALILLDFIAIARYIFIFWLKNPVAFNDEFWSTMINLWSFLATALLQFTQNFLPGKDYPDTWICSGEDPNLDPSQYYKTVTPNNIIKLASIIIHVAISLRINYYKWKIDRNEVARNPRSKIFWIFSLKTNSVVDVTESIIPFGLMAIGMVMNLPRRNINLEKLNQHPECLTEYFYTLMRPILTILLAGSIKLIRDERYRNTMVKEIRNLLSY